MSQIGPLLCHSIDKLYGSKDEVWERHRHRYEVNPEKVPELEKAGMKFVGRDEKGERMEIMELKGILVFLVLADEVIDTDLPLWFE